MQIGLAARLPCTERRLCTERTRRPRRLRSKRLPFVAAVMLTL